MVSNKIPTLQCRAFRA